LVVRRFNSAVTRAAELRRFAAEEPILGLLILSTQPFTYNPSQFPHAPITVVLNWFTELQQRVPTK
jgi:hypothetical protein